MSRTDKLATRDLEIVDIINETPDTRSFVLKTADGGALEYKAGQFLTFVFKRLHGKEVRRSYSISSCPDLNEPLTVTVKRIPNGEISRILMEKTHPGDRLTTIGASGFFVLPENPENYRRIVFIAAGSGITPVFSLLKTVMHSHPHIEALLVYSNKNVKHTIFHDELHRLQKVYAHRLIVEYLFSSLHDVSRSRLTPDILAHILGHRQVNNFATTLFYICGPGDYMRMANIALISFGVPLKNIKREIFHVQQPALTPEPPDKQAHNVQLYINGDEFSFNVQYPITILQAAKLLHVPVPFSCETGQCGTCVAKCLHGKVWMARNEVLLEEEIEGGQVLTCTGFPVGGDVAIKI
jgi:ring-1,2-phenylacetyl-CoA epoxidase subunit PaaE